MSTLQDRVVAWHAARFPDAGPEHVALKGCEEMGEVAEAVNGLWAGVTGAVGSGDLLSEAADVVVCMMALVGRWAPGADLLEAVEAKLAVLSDPSSGHRSAVLR